MIKTSSLFVAASMALAAPLASAQDAKLGATKAAMCIGCHGIAGYQASFPQVYRVPMIAGQNAKYIEAALGEYAKGERKHPGMRGIAAGLSEQDMADLAAYYEQLGHSEMTVPDTPIAPSEEVAALLTKGACSSCHGANYNKPIDGAYPKLAGQHADYLYLSLKSYKAENLATFGRGNAIMRGQVSQYTLPELKAIANYLGSLPGDVKTVPQSRFR